MMRETLGLALVVILLLAAACATTGDGRNAAAVIPVRVENDLVSGITVSIDPAEAPPWLLGSVSPGDSRTFQYTGGAGLGAHRLVAETTGGDQIVSRPFDLFTGAAVTWDLYTGGSTITVTDG